MWPFNQKPKVEQVKCDECKHYIDRKDAYEVKYRVFCMDATLFYCPMHIPPYDIIRVDSVDYKTRFFKTIPTHTIEVTEDGK